MMSVFKSLLGREEAAPPESKQTLCGPRSQFQQTAALLSDHPSRVTAARRALLERGFLCPDQAVTTLAKFEQVAKTEPKLIVLWLSPNPPQALEVLSRLRERSTARILVAGPNDDPQLILQALRHGADEYLDEKEVGTEIVTVLSTKKSGFHEAISQGKVIAVLGATGGAGVSTLVANTGCVLAMESQKVMLMDLQADRGALAPLLDLKPTFTIKDLAQQKPDRTVLERSLIAHACGAKLLASPSRLEIDPTALGEAVTESIRVGKMLFGHVILDLGSHLGVAELEHLKQADRIFLVLQLNFLSVKNAQAILQYVRDKGIDPKHVTLIVNRFGQVGELDLATVEESLEQPLTHRVPDEPKTVHRALNQGQPFVVTHPKAHVARAVQQIAEMLIESKKQ